MARIKVKLGPRSYTVALGTATWRRELTSALERLPVVPGRLFVLTDAQVFALYGQQVMRAVAKRGRSVHELVLPVGEKAKQAGVMNNVYDYLLAEQVSRDDFILAVGGGVVSDVAGFAAATVLRGIRWGILSTTLLGIVDAAIGGKTGINHDAGKNLIGAFWQPSFVIGDTELLQTLDRRQMSAGMGEVLKYAGLVGEPFLKNILRYERYGDLYDDRSLARLARLAVAYKGDIVARDEREGHTRMLLNVGHTFAHAIEQSLGYGRLLHGESVTLGLLGAIELSCRLKPSRSTALADYRAMVQRFVARLPRRKLDPAAVMAAMRLDKKRRGERLRFVLLEAPGRPFITDTAAPRAVRVAVAAMIDYYQAKGDGNAASTHR